MLISIKENNLEIKKAPALLQRLYENKELQNSKEVSNS